MSYLLIISVAFALVHGNELSLTFNAAESTCTAHCSTCLDAAGSEVSGGSDAFYELLNITLANSHAIQEALQEITRISTMVSSLKNSATTTSATVNDVLILVEELVQQHNDSSATPESPLPTSCSDIKQRSPTSPSGEYLIQTASGGSQYVYCYMDTLCDSDDGWTRLAHLDMSDPSEDCPQELRMYQKEDVRVCGRQVSSVGSCDSVIFSPAASYTQVCGRVTGYQNGQTNTVYAGDNDALRNNIDSFYVDGVSITRGSPRQHVWTFMAGNEERHTRGFHDCPCNTGNTGITVPSFIGDNYFCESSYPTFITEWPFIISDPLWDGDNCNYLEGPCCSLPGFPWFNKVLSSPSTDYLELRVCSDSSTSVDTPVSLYEIYIK